MSLMSFNYILYNKGCVRLLTYIYILLIIENTTGRPHLKFIVGTVLHTGTTISEHYKDELLTERHSNFTIQTSGCNKILSPNAQEFRLSGLLGDHIVATN
jgi:hypothetical protein